jgi:hypothetical protein
MKLAKKVAVVTAPVVALASSAVSAFAQTTINVNLDSAGFKITDFGKLLTGLLNMVMFIAALLVFAYLIWGGIQWITSGGDKGKTEDARNKITAAIIGLAVVAASYAIFVLVTSFLGVVDPFTSDFRVPTAFN